MRDHLCGEDSGPIRPHVPALCGICRAAVHDAEAIAALYCEAYPPLAGLPAGSGYPFPQYMSPAWMARSLSDGEFCWLAAKQGEELIGCLGAISISRPNDDDHIAELTGLVVKTQYRGKGIGTALLNAMCHELDAAGTMVSLAETRTGNLGGYKGTAKAGFIPIGFEPFAHNIRGQPEHMIMMARLKPSAYESRTLGYNTSPMAHDLGQACLRFVHQPVPPGRSISASEINQQHFCQGPLTVVRTGPAVLERHKSVSNRASPHRSGIIGLRRIQGVDYGERRFLDLHYMMRRRDRFLGAAQISVDLQDHRARVLRLEVEIDGLQAIFLRRVLDHLRSENILQPPACVVVDVRADFAPLHLSLQTLGFVPTVYYPALVSIESRRIDAVQFTQIIGDERLGFPAPPVELGAAAADIIRTVLAFRDQQISGSEPRP